MTSACNSPLVQPIGDKHLRREAGTTYKGPKRGCGIGVGLGTLTKKEPRHLAELRIPKRRTPRLTAVGRKL